MTLLPWSVLLCVPFVYASLPSLNNTSPRILDASNCPSSNTRSLWDIILSCGLTLFACTWTAVHPNIPGMDEGKIAITSRRLFIMVIALIAPELMITWATRQFLSARDAAKDFRDNGLIIIVQRDATHGADRVIPGSTSTVFLNGHVTLREAAEDINEAFSAQGAATHSNDQDISESPAMLASDVSEAGRSSGASGRYVELKQWTITHGFFAWMGGFMLYVDGMPRATLTPDELLEFVCRGSVDMPVITEAEIEDRSKGDGLSKCIAILQLVWFVTQLVARYMQNLPITLLEIDTLAVAALTCISYALWWKKPKDVRYPYIVHLKATATPLDLLNYESFIHISGSYYTRIMRHIFHPIICLVGLAARPSSHSARYRRAPSLGGYKRYKIDFDPNLPTRYRVGKIILLIGCFSGMLFGGIHCLGWNYFFTATQSTLWRATSLLVICTPVIISLDVLSFMHRGRPLTTIVPGLFSGNIAALIYIAARITLIVLIIISLQSLPTGVYDTVAWTRFIPHL
ncbi:hypothetical protein BDR06DRAFT_414620 [Suillus hirtellus]|nr:hypothetical protein BDR06DRAFT_414620 [Suillus hirtellus]